MVLDRIVESNWKVDERWWSSKDENIKNHVFWAGEQGLSDYVHTS